MIAIGQTLLSFARSLDDCEDGSPEATIRLGFRAMAGLFDASVHSGDASILSLEESLAVLNIMSAGMDRMLELSELRKIELPFSG